MRVWWDEATRGRVWWFREARTREGAVTVAARGQGQKCVQLLGVGF